jgi:hypothetical protein
MAVLFHGVLIENEPHLFRKGALLAKTKAPAEAGARVTA